MILNAVVFGFGSHEAAWRRPNTSATAPLEIAHWLDCARQAEAAGFDGLFLGDILCLQDRREHHPSKTLDPFMVLAAVAGATTRLKLIGTASTSFNHPWHLARRILSLQHLTEGRAGWNIVTSSYPQEAANFGWSEMPDTEERYARAEDVVRAVRALWSGWDGIARVADQASGRWLDMPPPAIEAEAQLASLTRHLSLAHAIPKLERFLGLSLSGLDLDAPVPFCPGDLAENRLSNSRARILLTHARRKGLTFRQMLAGFAASRGHLRSSEQGT